MRRISKELEREVRGTKDRCGYCLAPQRLVSYKLEIEHIIPISKGGTSEASNLCLACRNCNLHKSSKMFGFDSVSAKRTRLFNPNSQNWAEHFVWTKDKTSIIGKPASGRATIYALKINDYVQKNARNIWRNTGLFPPVG